MNAEKLLQSTNELIAGLLNEIQAVADDIDQKVADGYLILPVWRVTFVTGYDDYDSSFVAAVTKQQAGDIVAEIDPQRDVHANSIARLGFEALVKGPQVLPWRPF